MDCVENILEDQLLGNLQQAIIEELLNDQEVLPGFH